jgi:ferric-dicitrate binding protein FerR (iron transport regulator)
MNEEEYNIKLAKYLGGEMSGAESDAFRLEQVSHGVEPAGLESLDEKWNGMGRLKVHRAPGTRAAWNRLHERLRTDGLIPTRQEKEKSRFVPFMLRIAAVIAVITAIAAVIYFQISRHAAPVMVSISTGQEESTLVKTLSDGSVIYLAQHSQFSFAENFEPESRTVALTGKAFFDIEADPERPFVIETEEATIRVLGTAFHVKTLHGSDFELLVERGKVNVTLKKSPSVSEIAVAGEKISAVGNRLARSRQAAADSTDWYRQRMHFKDENLSNILMVLNRNFNTTFAAANQETGSRRLTVTFTNETPETMARLICMTLNLKSQITNGAVVFSENPDGKEGR